MSLPFDVVMLAVSYSKDKEEIRLREEGGRKVFCQACDELLMMIMMKQRRRRRRPAIVVGFFNKNEIG